VRAIVQLKFSIPTRGKVEISPGALHPESTHQPAPSYEYILNIMSCIGPKAEKRISSNLGGQSTTLGANGHLLII